MTLSVWSSDEEEAAMRWSLKVSSSCSSCGRRSRSRPSKKPFTSSGPPSSPPASCWACFAAATYMFQTYNLVAAS